MFQHVKSLILPSYCSSRPLHCFTILSVGANAVCIPCSRWYSRPKISQWHQLWHTGLRHHHPQLRVHHFAPAVLAKTQVAQPPGNRPVTCLQPSNLFPIHRFTFRKRDHQISRCLWPYLLTGNIAHSSYFSLSLQKESKNQ